MGSPPNRAGMAVPPPLAPAAGSMDGNGRVTYPGYALEDMDARSPVAEAFRTLRANLQFAAVGTPLRTIVVTGVGPDEGKTTIAAHLAVVMAQNNLRTLAVGCDLRRPSVHRFFGLRNDRGLTTVLMGRLPVAEAIQMVAPWPLGVLPAGPIPPNPAELLGSEQMRGLLEELKTQWDVILLDTPPVVAVSDAAVLGARCDGVLLVLTAGSVPRDAALEARRQLERVQARVLGVVLNRVRPENVKAHYYYYYYYSDDDGTHRHRRGGART